MSGEHSFPSTSPVTAWPQMVLPRSTLKPGFSALFAA